MTNDDARVANDNALAKTANFQCAGRASPIRTFGVTSIRNYEPSELLTFGIMNGLIFVLIVHRMEEKMYEFTSGLERFILA